MLFKMEEYVSVQKKPFLFRGRRIEFDGEVYHYKFKGMSEEGAYMEAERILRSSDRTRYILNKNIGRITIG